MDPFTQSCNDLNRKLNSNDKSIKDLKTKAQEIQYFCNQLSDKNFLIKFSHSKFVISLSSSILEFAGYSSLKSNLPDIILISIINFFKAIIRFNIPLCEKCENIGQFKNVMINIISIEIPKSEKWDFWTQIFTQIVEIPTFYNLFCSDTEKESLFSLVGNLLKLSKLYNEKDNVVISHVLEFFLKFIKNSPYPPIPDMIERFFLCSNELIKNELSDKNFATLLSILNSLIPLSPITFLTNQQSSPFCDEIFELIHSKWTRSVQKIQNLRQSASIFLYIYLTINKSLNFPVKQEFIENWTQKIIEVWGTEQNRSILSGSLKDIPYLKADIEFIKLSQDTTISDCLISAFLSQNSINISGSQVMLIIAIGKYSPDIIKKEDWIRIMEKITSIDIRQLALLNSSVHLNLYYLIMSMIDIIDETQYWNPIYIYLTKIQKNATENLKEFYQLLENILSKQKIDTSIAHKNQNTLWKGNLNQIDFPIERLSCIHTFIYYYGFANDETRGNCLKSMISLLTSINNYDIPYIKQLSLVICSTFLSHAPLLFIKNSLLSEYYITNPEFEEANNAMNKILTITPKTILTPIQNDQNFLFSAQSTQVEPDDNDLYDSYLEIPNFEQEESVPTKQNFALCNFLQPQIQNNYCDIIKQTNSKTLTLDLFFKLYITFNAPEFFSISQYNEMISSKIYDIPFNVLIDILYEISKESSEESFQPFFEGIQYDFFDLMERYLGECQNEIIKFKNNNSSWVDLENASLLPFYQDVPKLIQFASKCSYLVSDFLYQFWDKFEEFLSLSFLIPWFHLNVCKHLLEMSLDQPQISTIISSLKSVLIFITSEILVPIKEQELFLNELFSIFQNSLSTDQCFIDLFQAISNIYLTPSEKLLILNLIKTNFHKAPSLFDCFWKLDDDDSDPFYLLDQFPQIRLQSVESLLELLKFKETENEKFDKYGFFNEMIYSSLDGIFQEPKKYLQDTFTGLKLVVQIASSVPELSLKCIVILLKFFSKNGLDLFTHETLNLLLLSLSNRVHFSLFLRQFIPILVKKFIHIGLSPSSFPYKLFFFEENLTQDQQINKFFSKAGMYLIPYALISDNKSTLFKEYKEILHKNSRGLIEEYALPICSLLLITQFTQIDKSQMDNCKRLYDKAAAFLPDGKEFDSPIPLISFLTLVSDDRSITKAYKMIIRTNHSPGFIDIRLNIFILYSKIFSAQHELVQAHYLRQFILYINILFEFHNTIFEEKPTLYVDLLGYVNNLLEFIPITEAIKLLTIVSKNIPINLTLEYVGLIDYIEDICMKNPRYYIHIKEFFERFLDLPSRMMIFDFILKIQKRTPAQEFIRISRSKRINNDSICFLLNCFITDDNLDSLDNIPNNIVRDVLNQIYEYSLKNPQSLALQLYSEMYLKFEYIHPSPLITKIDEDPYETLFKSLILLTRNKDFHISKESLTVLSKIVSDTKNDFIPQEFIDKHKALYEQLQQYKKWGKPTKSQKQIDPSSPWISRFIYNLISKLFSDSISFYFGNLCAILPEFAKEVFSFVINDSIKDEHLFNYIKDAMKFCYKNHEKRKEECKYFIIGFHQIRIKWFDLNQKHKEKLWYLMWKEKKMPFKLLMNVCLAIGDPYSAFQFAEFALESNSSSIDSNSLKKIFSLLDIPVLQYCLPIDLSNSNDIASLHILENRTSKALILFDNINNTEAISKTIKSLHLYNFLDNLSIENTDSLWRLQKWNVPSQLVREMSNDSYSANLFQAMQAIATHNEVAISKKLCDFSESFKFETNSSISTQLSKLLDAYFLKWFETILFPNKNSQLFNLLSEKTLIHYKNCLNKLINFSKRSFSTTENAIALNGIFFCIAKSYKTGITPGLVIQFFSDIISSAKENHNIESAQYFVSLLQKCQTSHQYSDFEQINLLYYDDPINAIKIIKDKINSLLLPDNEQISEKIQPFNLKVYLTYASWAAQTHYLYSDKIIELLNNVIDKSIHIKATSIEADAHFVMAKFYHSSFNQVCDYFLTAEYEKITKIVESSSDLLLSSTNPPIEIKKYNKDIENYKFIINKSKTNFAEYITSAIRHYLLCLKLTEKFDIESLFSLIGLWFTYSYTKFKPFVQEIPSLIATINEIFLQLNPIKFLPLFYQLAARITEINEISSTQGEDYNLKFQSMLRIMVEKICKSSPIQCFPVLFALLKNNEKPTSGRYMKISSDKRKIEAIEELIHNFTSDDEELSSKWDTMSKFLQSYLDISKSFHVKKENTLQKLYPLLPDLFDYCKSKNEEIPIITSSKNISISSIYDNITILNGINNPLLLKIRGKDGKLYKQIIKGNKDDLRQDAVMQQLFVLSSKLLLKTNPDLSIRSYKVIPISPICGIIEFVEGSISIQDYLAQQYIDETSQKTYFKGAHQRYRISKITYEQAYIEFRKASKFFYNMPNEKNASKLTAVFKEIRTKFRPVFRFFFLENFKNQADWFLSRIRYSRHTATNSMVGYILGIGDRHLNNILIDKKNGEVIHIDLGIAFEQGKSLPVPELVPFRLTEEIIDGMGWKGIDGVFRKSCEQAMKVLRNNVSYFMTVLEVFINDPLYSWSLPMKVSRNAFRSNTEESPKAAESAILQCESKLKGRETGEILSVEGQVAQLITEATNERNLSLIFNGWKPFL